MSLQWREIFISSIKFEKISSVDFYIPDNLISQRKKKAIKIESPSTDRDKSINSLTKLASKKLRRNPSDIESLSILGFIHKVKGEMNEALEYYERALRLAPGLENSAVIPRHWNTESSFLLVTFRNALCNSPQCCNLWTITQTW